MVNWSKGILNSFDCRYTNGFTEGVNNKIKVIKLLMDTEILRGSENVFYIYLITEKNRHFLLDL